MDDEQFTELAVAADKRNITRAEMIRILVRQSLLKNNKNEVAA
jgi:hypothetical protein